MRALAIDFETANQQHASACAVGLAWIEDWQVVRSEHRLIRPMEMRFSPINISIHGIRPEHVVEAPEFPDAMAGIADELEGAIVFAHNASFELSVWRKSHELYGLSTPELRTMCTLEMARAGFPSLNSHKLSIVSEHLNIPLDHHDPRSDAVASAEIACELSRRFGVDDPQVLAVKLGLFTSRRRAQSSRVVSKPKTEVIVAGTRFSGKVFVFTGSLRAMTRDTAREIVISNAGSVSDSVSGRTDIVVAGPGAGSKLKKAAELGLQVMDEDVWLELVSQL